MPKNPQASTQQFTEIIDIIEDLVFFRNGSACIVIEIASTNFALLSGQEQEVRVAAYAAFLNSLSFPIQILVSNRRVDVSSYVALLDSEITRTQNPKVSEYMRTYRDFVQQLVKQNIVLDKNFYIAIAYSALEAGPTGALASRSNEVSQDLLAGAKASLHTKADEVRDQLRRMNLSTKILQKERLITVFHNLYNHPLATESNSAKGGQQ